MAIASPSIPVLEAYLEGVEVLRVQQDAEEAGAGYLRLAVRASNSGAPTQPPTTLNVQLVNETKQNTVLSICGQRF